MNRYFIISIFLTIGVLKSAYGLRWVPIDGNDHYSIIPQNIILIGESSSDDQMWVARVKTPSGEIYPARIYSWKTAFYKRYHNSSFENLNDRRSEILTTAQSDDCQWKPHYYGNHSLDIDQNAVRAGVDSNGDPIFVGRYQFLQRSKTIGSIFLPKGKNTQVYEKIENYNPKFEQWEYLSCDTKNRWVDYETTHLPDNAVSGGKSNNKYEILVARLKLADGNFITGYVIPEMNATVFENLPQEKTDSDELNNVLKEESNETNDSDVVQILIGKSGEYEWVSIENGTIPDYAVVNGNKNLEPAYVARINKSIRHITQTEAREQKSRYEILIKNEIDNIEYNDPINVDYVWLINEDFNEDTFLLN